MLGRLREEEGKRDKTVGVGQGIDISREREELQHEAMENNGKSLFINLLFPGLGLRHKGRYLWP